jgi:hypothetical protein
MGQSTRNAGVLERMGHANGHVHTGYVLTNWRRTSNFMPHMAELIIFNIAEKGVLEIFGLFQDCCTEVT